MRPEELFEFPCDHIFKAFGAADPDAGFTTAVHSAVAAVVPVGRDSMKERVSREGTYACVSVVVRVQNFAQVEKIYTSLKAIPGLRFLL